MSGREIGQTPKGRLQQIPVSEIVVGYDRIRSTDPVVVKGLADDIAQRGLFTAIALRYDNGKFHLIAGAHRLEAVKALNWGTILSVVFEVDAETAFGMEVSENIMRSQLEPLDMCEAFAREKFLYEEAHPETRHGGDRKSEEVSSGRGVHLIADDGVAEAKSFADMMAETIGRHPRTVRRYLALTGIKSAIRETIRESATSLRLNLRELEALSKVAPELQHDVVSRILDGSCPTVKAALDDVTGRREFSPDERSYDRILVSWSKLSAGIRCRFLNDLAEEDLPEGYVVLRPGQTRTHG